MRKLSVIALLILSCAGSSQAQLEDYYNKNHRQLLGNPTATTRIDTIIFRGAIALDSAISAIRGIGNVVGYTINAEEYSTLSAAIDAAVASPTKKLVQVTTAQAITVTDTLPATVGLIVYKGGSIALSSGATFKVWGPFFAEPFAIFSGSGSVVFGPGSIRAAYGEWWGAVNDSTDDCGPAFKKAVDAIPSGGVLELLGDSQNLRASLGYIVNTTVRLPSRKTVAIKGNGVTIYSSATDTVFLIQNGSQDAIPAYAVSPTTSQPRHVLSGIRFKRISGATGAGVAIAVVNSTAQAFENIDVADYNNAFVFHNISAGWCENNEIFNSRIAGCDTAISYMLSLSGNNSMATNSLRKVTITRFTDSDVINQGASRAVGIFADTGTNLYRNVWDQVVIFPKDSVTCVYIDGKAEDLSGTINFEYIGSTEANQMRGFHFGANSSDLRFHLHTNLTGRRYFNPPNIFYSQIPGSFGFTGITTSLDASQNHGIEWVVDSTKFTPLVSVLRANRVGVTSPNDSSRIFYAQANNSADGSLDLRARRDKPIEIRSLTDGVYSSLTANSVGGSALPFQPVRALIVGSNRTISNQGPLSLSVDSSTVDIRTTTFLLFGSGNNTIDSLIAFKGGIVTQNIEVQFSDDSTMIANLSGGTGTGRLFLKENKNLRSVTGLRMAFRCEAETGGVFWREKWRQWPEQTNTITDNDATPAVGTLTMLRLNNAGSTTVTNFLENSGSISGRSERVVTLVFLNGNTTITNNSNIVLAGAANFTGASGDVLRLQYDETSAAWREISRSRASSGSGGSGWQDDGTNVRLETTTDNTTIGDNTNAGKLTIDGDTDEIQLYIKGHSTQNEDYIRLVKSDATSLMAFGQNATTVAYLGMPNNGSIGLGGAHPASVVNGLTIYNGTAGSTPTNGFTLYALSGEPLTKDNAGLVSRQVNSWGALYMSNATQVISTSGTAGTWIKVTGFTPESSPAGQGITAVADSLTALAPVTATYEISVNMSFQGGTASTDNYKIAIAKNGTVNTNYQAAATTIDNSSRVSMGFTGFYSGTSGDDFSLVMTNNTDGDDPTIVQCTITMRRLN